MKTSSSSPPFGLPILSLAVLFAIFLLALDALHLQLGRISYSDLIAPVLDPNDDRLRKTYTSIPQIDKSLTIVLTMFMPIFTWEMPELTLFSAHFAGQIPAHLTLMIVEGMRKGKTWALTWATTWMIAMQAFGYGVVMPVYYITDLLLSSHSPPDLRPRSPSKLQSRVFIPAIALGYVLPSGLQLLHVSEDLHQIFLALWQPFPIYVVFFFQIFAKMHPLTPSPLGKQKAKSDLEGINQIYTFSIAFGALTHWATIIITFLWPYLSSGALVQQPALLDTFIPHGVHWYGSCSIAQASIQFLQWDYYCGASAGVVWAVTLAHRAGVFEFGVLGLGEVIQDIIIFGMPSTVLKILWKRDAVMID